MNAWLRATVTDIRDPEGTGANLVGDDLYTGAGLVNANRAATQGMPDPVVVDVLVEGGGRVGRPDLGITVKGPVVQWRLDYGASDWPRVWLSLDVPLSVASQEIDVPRTATGLSVDVAPGHNYLDTDHLTNRQVYTLRLTATDAQGRTYIAYDWFMPIRAMLYHPDKNDAVPTKWGWPNIYGTVDLRPGATYELQVIDPFGSTNPDWHVGPIPIDNIWPRLEAEHRNTSRYAILMSPECTAPQIEICNHGWGMTTSPPAFQAQPIGQGTHTIRLTVYSPGGIVTRDTQEIYVDNTAFPTRPGWPVAIPRNLSFVPGLFPYPRGVAAAAMTGTSDRRIFIHTDGHLVSLQPHGTILWDLPLRFEQDLLREDQRFGPSFLIDDLDGDGTKEILVCNAGNILLLKADGTRYSQNSTFPSSHGGCGKLHAGDVNGDGVKEVIFVKRSRPYMDPPEEAELYVVGLNGQPFAGWPVALPGRCEAALQVGDVDGNGRADILVENIWLYGGNGQLRPGWPISNSFGNSSRGGFQLVELNPATPGSGLQILAYDLIGTWPGGRYAVDVRKPDGAVYASRWPVYLDSDVERNDRGYSTVSPIYAKIAQLIPGDPLEIVVCYDKIRVLQADGSENPALPPIDLNGQCHGLDVLDVDGDGQLEYVALVSRFEDDDGWKTDAHAELEAYRLNGTPLSATDSRWPIRVVSPSSETSMTGHIFMALRNSVTLQDVDGDGGLDFIQSLFLRPYRAGGNNFGLRDNLIEVLNIR